MIYFFCAKTSAYYGCRVSYLSCPPRRTTSRASPEGRSMTVGPPKYAVILCQSSATAMSFELLVNIDIMYNIFLTVVVNVLYLHHFVCRVSLNHPLSYYYVLCICLFYNCCPLWLMFWKMKAPVQAKQDDVPLQAH